MNAITELALLKIDLGINGEDYDERLQQYLTAAAAAITREGITLTDSVEDANLKIMYAAWMWRKRTENVGLPRMLRWQLNNRLLSEKAQDG